MGYTLTEEQLDLKNVVAEFMSKEVKPRLHEIDASGEFPVDLYKQAFEIGLHMLEIPEEYGGSGLDHQTVGIRRFNDHIAEDKRVEQVILPLRDGLTIIRKL